MIIHWVNTNNNDDNNNTTNITNRIADINLQYFIYIIVS